MVQAINKYHGNRALVCYLYGENFREKQEEFTQFVTDFISDKAGDSCGTSDTWVVSTPQTFHFALVSGDWMRRLIVGNCPVGDCCAGVFFYTEPVVEQEPDPGDPADLESFWEDADEPEPEPGPSITQLVSEALVEKYPGSINGGSSFVINPQLFEFELIVTE